MQMGHSESYRGIGKWKLQWKLPGPHDFCSIVPVSPMFTKSDKYKSAMYGEAFYTIWMNKK